MTSKLFRRILVPHDFSDAADRALRQAAALAEPRGGRLRVLHVLPPFYLPIDMPSRAMPDPYDLVPDQRRALEQRVRKVLGASQVRVSVAVEVGQPADVIVAAARRADSIVMATQGRTGLPHLLMGSIAERVVRLSPVPVLTYRRRARKPPATKAARRRAA